MDRGAWHSTQTRRFISKTDQIEKRPILYCHPLVAVGGASDGIKHLLNGEPILEVGMVLAVVRDSSKELVILVDKRVLPANNVPWGPPVVVIGVVRISHEDGLEPTVVGSVNLQLIQSLQRETESPI